MDRSVTWLWGSNMILFLQGFRFIVKRFIIVTLLWSVVKSLGM